MKVHTNFVDHQRSFEEVRRRQNSALFNRNSVRGRWLVRNKIESCRKSLVSRWPLVLSAKLMALWASNHRRSAHHQNRRASKPLARSIDEIEGGDGIQRCCPTGINGSIPPRVSRRDWRAHQHDGLLVRGCSAWARTGTDGCFDERKR